MLRGNCRVWIISLDASRSASKPCKDAGPKGLNGLLFCHMLDSLENLHSLKKLAKDSQNSQRGCYMVIDRPDRTDRHAGHKPCSCSTLRALEVDRRLIGSVEMKNGEDENEVILDTCSLPIDGNRKEEDGDLGSGPSTYIHTYSSGEKGLRQG